MYDELDKEIIKIIMDGHTKFFDIWIRVKTPLPAPRVGGKARAVDSRLQALRKKHLIEYRKGGWVCL